MEESRLKIARKKRGLTQKAAAKIIGITPQAWNSAERGKSKMHRKNLKMVAKEFDVSFSWLVTGEGDGTMSMPEDIGPGRFVRIRSAGELLTGERSGETRHVFVPGMEVEAIGFTTRSELPVGVVESTLIVVEADFGTGFENGKLYLIRVDGLLIVRRIDKVVFGREKGSFKLTGLDGTVDFVGRPEGIELWRVVFRLDGLG